MSSKGKFLVARWVLKPRTRFTQKAGWMADPNNIQWDEQVGFLTKVKTRDYQEWNVILDLEGNKVLLSSSPLNYEGSLFADRDFEKFISYFKEHYSKQIEQFVKV